jgi:hypothetical protein
MTYCAVPVEPAAFCVCCGTPRVSTSPQKLQTNTCTSGRGPNLATVRISGITSPHRPQTAKGRLLGKAAIAAIECVLAILCNAQ